MALNIQRINFDPIGGDSATAAFRKLDLGVGELANAIDGDGSATTGLANRVNTSELKISLLGNASTKNVGTVEGTVAAGDDSRFKAVGTTSGTVAAGDDLRFSATAAAAAAAQATANAAIPKTGSAMTAGLKIGASGAQAMATIWPDNDKYVGLTIGTGGNQYTSSVIGFLRDGAYGAYFGIDTDNQWKLGGRSMGVYRLWHEGNTTVDGNNFIKRI